VYPQRLLLRVLPANQLLPALLPALVPALVLLHQEAVVVQGHQMALLL